MRSIVRFTVFSLALGALVLASATSAKASEYDESNYGKNKLYNLRATVGGGSTVYGSYTKSILQRADGAVTGDTGDSLLSTAPAPDPATVTPSSGSSTVQTVLLQRPTDGNPGGDYLLLSGSSNFKPGDSSGGVAYDTRTTITKTDSPSTVYAVDRVALLSNPFTAIFGNIFANNCAGCNKLSFGQKGTGTSSSWWAINDTSLKAAGNLANQVPGYYIQGSSVLYWDSSNQYYNAIMKSIVNGTVNKAHIFSSSTYDASRLNFTYVPQSGSVGISTLKQTGDGGTKEGIILVEGDLDITSSLTVWGKGTVIVEGNLTINKNIQYQTGDNGPIGFIVLGKRTDTNGDGKIDDNDEMQGGTVTIKSGVTNLKGMFFAPGPNGNLVIETSTGNGLTAKGVFAATNITLNKRGGQAGATGDGAEDIAKITNEDYNVAILYDPRIQSDPPPGFSYGEVSGDSQNDLYSPAAP